MKPVPQFRWTDCLWFLFIVVLAGGARGWYFYECLDNGKGAAPFVVQEPSPGARVSPGTKLNGNEQPTEMDHLIRNLDHQNGFTSTPPLYDLDEEVETAHISPGYPWMIYLVSPLVYDSDGGEDFAMVLFIVRLAQCIIGALTAGLYFAFARSAFRSLSVALVAGTFCAVNPFGIINCGELSDGVLSSFLLAMCLLSGTHAGKTGGPVASLIFGLSLAGSALVRAAMLPFAFVGLLWFVGRCRNLQRGWLCALLAVLGFANGMAPWMVRNYQVFGDVVPVVNSAYVHLWMGNNPKATGVVDNQLKIVDVDPTKSNSISIEDTLTNKRLAKLKTKTIENDSGEKVTSPTKQTERYALLAEDTWDYVRTHPTETVQTRARNTVFFFLGREMFNGSPFQRGQDSSHTPELLVKNYDMIMSSVLLAMFLLGILGWRWSYASSRNAGGLAAVAVVFVSLPYILGHVTPLWGPRLPLDGILLSYCAVGVMSVLTNFRSPSSTRTM